MNRREFLKKALAVSGIMLLKGPNAALADTGASSSPAGEEVPPLPWGYVELDPEYVRRLGHLGYYAFECAGGAFWAIMWALREKMGHPYTLVPIPTKDEVLAALKGKKELQVPMHFGAGGGGGFGSLCGALNGSCAAITMAVEAKLAKELTRKLFRWYEQAPIPSKTSNEYAATHQFFVPKYKSDKPLPQSVSESVLCHESVSKWCVRSGYASGSKERSERCARLTGDVAAMAVRFLNAHLHGNLDEVATIPLTQTTADCRRCHFKGKNYEEGQFTRGYMECESCHVDRRPHLGQTTVRTAFGVNVKTWAGAAAVGTVAGIGSHVATARVQANGKHNGKHTAAVVTPPTAPAAEPEAGKEEEP